MAQGVEISQIVRDAIRQEYNRRRRKKPLTTKRVRETLAKIYAEYPAPTDAPPHFNQSADRKALRAHIVKQMQRKRS